MACTTTLDIMQCPICYNLLEDPRVLSCGHTFCCSCLKKLPKGEGAYACPICRCGFPSIDALPKNILIEQLKSEKLSQAFSTQQLCQNCDQTASHWCKDCSASGTFYCLNCSESIHTPKALSQHNRLTLQEKLKQQTLPKCQSHQEDKKFCCLDCKILLCPICKEDNHQGHQTVSVYKNAELQREQLEAFVVPTHDAESVARLLQKSRFAIEQDKIELAKIEAKSQMLRDRIAQHENDFANASNLIDKPKNTEALLKNLVKEMGVMELADFAQVNNVKETINSTLSEVLSEKERLEKEILKKDSQRLEEMRLESEKLRWKKVSTNKEILSEIRSGTPFLIDTALTTISLINESIGENGAKPLCDALKVNNTLTSIDLSNSKIGENGFKNLCEALKFNNTLKSITLEQSNIGERGVQNLCEALKLNSTLTSIGLSNNDIGDNGAKHLGEILKFNSTLTSIGLSNNKIERDGVQHLSEALKVNKTLTTFRFERNNIGANEAKHLCEALKVNKTLTMLALFNNNIGESGAQHFCEALKLNSTLASLDLSNNNIGENGAKYLCEALKVNKGLTTLALFSNNIGEKGGKLFCEVLKSNSTLTSIGLVYNNIRPGDLAALKAATAKNLAKKK